MNIFTSIFPYGIHWNPSPDAILIVPLTILFLFLTIKALVKNKFAHKFFKYFAWFAVIWNILTIYSQLFYIVLPISNEVLSYILYGLWGIVLFEVFYTKKKETTKSAENLL